jgi:hypothetical protein
MTVPLLMKREHSVEMPTVAEIFARSAQVASSRICTSASDEMFSIRGIHLALVTPPLCLTWGKKVRNTNG